MLEKRIGIIFLADIVDYTLQAVKLGTHKTKSFSDNFKKELESLSGQYDGEFIKTIGDAVLIFFENHEKFLTFVEELKERSRKGMFTYEDFSANLRMVAHYGNFGLELSNEKISDLFGPEGIKIFRLEKFAGKHEVIITHFLYSILKDSMIDRNITGKYLGKEKLKGFGEKETDLYELIFPGNGKMNDRMITDRKILNEVLFDMFLEEHESYYIERDEDEKFQDNLELHSIWLSGPSGCGKTTCIKRNLLKKKKEHVYIDLSCYTNYSMLDLFNGIYRELLKELKRDTSNYVAERESAKILKKIQQLLKNYSEDKELYVHIDEIALDEERDFGQFVENIGAILTGFSKKDNIKFVLASLNSPKRFIKPSRQKVLEKIKMINQKYWNQTDTRRLLNMICRYLNIKFTFEERQNIVKQSKGSPRAIKKFIDKYIYLCNKPQCNIYSIMEETLRDLDRDEK